MFVVQSVSIGWILLFLSCLLSIFVYFFRCLIHVRGGYVSIMRKGAVLGGTSAGFLMTFAEGEEAEEEELDVRTC